MEEAAAAGGVVVGSLELVVGDEMKMRPGTRISFLFDMFGDYSSSSTKDLVRSIISQIPTRLQGCCICESI